MAINAEHEPSLQPGLANYPDRDREWLGLLSRANRVEYFTALLEVLKAKAMLEATAFSFRVASSQPARDFSRLQVQYRTAVEARARSIEVMSAAQDRVEAALDQFTSGPGRSASKHADRQGELQAAIDTQMKAVRRSTATAFALAACATALRKYGQQEDDVPVERLKVRDDLKAMAGGLDGAPIINARARLERATLAFAAIRAALFSSFGERKGGAGDSGCANPDAPL